MKLMPSKFLAIFGLNNTKSVSLIELMVSIIVVGTMVLSFYSLETYSHQQVMGADRRTKVQNSLTFCLEHMSKYVQQAGGNNSKGYPAIALYPTSCSGATCTGFQARVDLNSTGQTPSDFSDDALVYYTLPVGSNTLSTGCTPQGTGDCGTFLSESLSGRIVAGFDNSSPANISADPTVATEGFFVLIDSSGSYADVGLVGRYDPDVL
ncbi:MAG: hypothetical protein NT014_05315, partial [Candidatus Omnitrophica bacterium]|nr:hypothetical protein [Candidatus Omnitrophota bacterium]